MEFSSSPVGERIERNSRDSIQVVDDLFDQQKMDLHKDIES